MAVNELPWKSAESDAQRAVIERRIGVVVLAAGGSTRMGKQKLLLELGGKSLVRRAAMTALSADLGDVVVVVGSDAAAVADELADLPVTVVENGAWETGQASSVRCGVDALGSCDAIVVMVADQPFVGTGHLRRLAAAHRTEQAAICASANGKMRGNPVLFDRSVFADLRELAGDQGARQLFGRFAVADIEQGEPNIFRDADDSESFRAIEETWVAEKGSRRLFPLLTSRSEGGLPLAYLDSAATSQVPEGVLAAQNRFEREFRSNIHRGLYPLAEEASDAYEQARSEVASFFGIPAQGAIFTHGATEALNLAVFGWAGACLSAGDLVLVDAGGHHANIVPWQMLAQQKGIELAFVDLDDCGLIDRDRWHGLLERKPKAVALTHMSNVTGLCNDLALLTAEAHAAGAVVVADCAQSAGHMPLDFAAAGVDFAAVSAHKMYGPFGIGLLWAAPEHAIRMRPLLGGGGMIDHVDTAGFTCTEAPQCFEAGTPNITGAIGFSAACRFLDDIGLAAIEKRGIQLCDKAVAGLDALESVRVVGEAETGQRSSIVSFLIEGVHPHDAAQALGERGVAVRAGKHCAMPLHDAMGIPASTRASFGVYSDERDVDRLIDGVVHAQKEYGRGR